MDLNQLKLLNDEQRQRYMALESLFSSPGWRIVMDEATKGKGIQEANMINAQDWAAHRTAYGAWLVLNQFLTFEEGTEREFEELAKPQIDDASEMDDRDFL